MLNDCNEQGNIGEGKVQNQPFKVSVTVLTSVCDKCKTISFSHGVQQPHH